MTQASQAEQARCEQLWTQAAQKRDRQAMRALRAELLRLQAQARAATGIEAREQWLAWVRLRCSLIIRRSSF